MAKELDIRNDQQCLFVSDSREFISEGQRAAQAALESVGGYLGLVEKLPFDRGDTNHGLVQLCLKMAAVVEQNQAPARGVTSSRGRETRRRDKGKQHAPEMLYPSRSSRANFETYGKELEMSSTRLRSRIKEVLLETCLENCLISCAYDSVSSNPAD